MDDIGLYEGLRFLEKKHIVGKVRGSVTRNYARLAILIFGYTYRFLPYIGYVTIAMVSLQSPFTHLVAYRVGCAERLPSAKIRSSGRSGITRPYTTRIEFFSDLPQTKRSMKATSIGLELCG